jgi:hypothetical protein
MAFFARRLSRQSAALADRLRAEAEAAGRRYAAGQCGEDEYQDCLDRFTRLILYGETPADSGEVTSE